MNDLSPRAKTLFERARAADQPTLGAQTRVARALATRLATGAVVGVGVVGAKSAWAAWAPMLKTMTWVSAGTAIALGTWHQLGPRLLDAARPIGPSRPAQSAPQSSAAQSSAALEHTTPRSPSLPAARSAVGIASEGALLLGDPRANRATSAPLALDAPEPANARAPSAASAVPNPSEPATLPAANFPQGGQKPLPPRAIETTRAAEPSGVPPAADLTRTPESNAIGLGAAGGNAAPRASSIAKEADGLREVQRALRDGQPALAVRLLDQHDTAFARGVLAQERSAARVQALCTLGQREHARAEADRFERRWPTSVLLARVRSHCSE